MDCVYSYQLDVVTIMVVYHQQLDKKLKKYVDRYLATVPANEVSNILHF